MRYAPLVRIWIVLGLLLTGAACDNGELAIEPTPPIVTETYSGEITRNGLQQHAFVATARGTVTATISALDPSTSPAIGFSMGTWDGSACTAVMTNRFATTSSSLSGAVVGITNLCIQLFDASGEIQSDTPVTYTVTVQRP